MTFFILILQNYGVIEDAVTFQTELAAREEAKRSINGPIKWRKGRHGRVIGYPKARVDKRLVTIIPQVFVQDFSR